MFAPHEAPHEAPHGVLVALKKYGISKSSLRYITYNHFNIKDMYRDCFKSYYTLFWERSYIESKIKDGTIRHNNVDYIVIFKNTSLNRLKKERISQVQLSFREPQDEFDIHPVVLVIAHSN